MSQQVGPKAQDDALVHFAGAPFFASASLMLVSLALLVRQRARHAPAPIRGAEADQSTSA